jgi:hypothetical protein
MFDVVIIGAGVAGLTCAQHLMQYTDNIIILEGSHFVGGRCAGFNGHDLGATWIHECSSDFKLNKLESDKNVCGNQNCDVNIDPNFDTIYGIQQKYVIMYNAFLKAYKSKTFARLRKKILDDKLLTTNDKNNLKVILRYHQTKQYFWFGSGNRLPSQIFYGKAPSDALPLTSMNELFVKPLLSRKMMKRIRLSTRVSCIVGNIDGYTITANSVIYNARFVIYTGTFPALIYNIKNNVISVDVMLLMQKQLYANCIKVTFICEDVKRVFVNGGRLLHVPGSPFAVLCWKGDTEILAFALATACDVVASLTISQLRQWFVSMFGVQCRDVIMHNFVHDDLYLGGYANHSKLEVDDYVKISNPSPHFFICGEAVVLDPKMNDCIGTVHNAISSGRHIARIVASQL